MFFESQTSQTLQKENLSKKISKKMFLQTSGFNFVYNFFMEILNLKRIFVLETFIYSPNFLSWKFFQKSLDTMINEAENSDFNIISSLS